MDVKWNEGGGERRVKFYWVMRIVYGWVRESCIIMLGIMMILIKYIKYYILFYRVIILK